MTKNLIEALEKQRQQTEQFNQKISGILGIPLGGQRRVEVAGRNAYVYVRLRSNQSEVIQAYNNTVATSYNLPVLVERQGNRYVVVSVDTQRYDNNWNSNASFLPRHGNTHSFDIESGGGGDIVWVYPRQFTPAMVMPSGSSGGDSVIVHPYTLQSVVDGSWKQVGNTGTSSFSPYLPMSPTGAVMALVYLDANSGNPYLLINSGTVFSNTITGSSQVAQFIPNVVAPQSQIPLAAIRLITGTNQISWDNIYDVRQFLQVSPSGSAGGALSSIPIQDEGASVGNATTLNFVGDGVQATISGSVARISVSGGGGSINTGTLDARYLKLDASNAPVLAPLTISGSVIVSTPSSKLVGSSTIHSGTTNTTNEVLLTRSANISHTGVAAYEGYGFYLQDTNPLGKYVGGVLYHRTKTGRETFINPYAPSGTVAEFISEIDVGTSGSILSLKNQGVQKFKVDGAGNANIPSGATYNINGTPHTHSGATFVTNKIINGQFNIAQLGTGFVSTSSPANSDDTYLLDQWILLSDGNDILDVSQDLSVVPAGATTSLKLDIETANKRAGVLELIEGNASADMISSAVASVSFVAKKVVGNSTVDKLRAIVLSWTGTMDVVTSDFISAWGTEGSNPTPVANWTIEGSQVFTLTDSFQTFSLENVAIDTSGAKNVALFIMVENDDGTVGDLVYITNVWMGASSSAPTYSARSESEEFLLCQRYLLNLFPASTGSLLMTGRVSSAVNDRSTFAQVLPVPFRKTPDVTQSGMTVASQTDGILNISDISIDSYRTTSINILTTSSNLTVASEPVFLRAGSDTAYVRLDARL